MFYHEKLERILTNQHTILLSLSFILRERGFNIMAEDCEAKAEAIINERLINERQ